MNQKGRQLERINLFYYLVLTALILMVAFLMSRIVSADAQTCSGSDCTASVSLRFMLAVPPVVLHSISDGQTENKNKYRVAYSGNRGLRGYNIQKILDHALTRMEALDFTRSN